MKTLTREHKQDYFVILLAVILVIIVYAIVYLSFTQKPLPKTPQIPPSTPVPTEFQVSPLPVQYDYAAEGRLAQVISQRPQLSQTDTQQKASMLNTILHGFNSGVLYETGNVRIEYVQSADMLMAEIKTTNIVKAKAEVTDWLLSQGISQEGICKLPVLFYVDPEIRQGLEGKNIIFSPLPNSC